MKNMYYGASVSNDLTDVSLTSLHQFENDATKKVPIVMWYQDWELGYNESFNPAFMTAVRNHGSNFLITWEPYEPGLSDPAHQPTHAPVNIIAGKFDTYITKLAQAAKAWGYPFFLRFAHKMNGDWVGRDGYNWGYPSWSTRTAFTDLFSVAYNQMRSITQKPMLICETASAESGGNKSLWISDMLSVALPYNFPAILGFIWFNVARETDWRIESSHKAQSTLAQGVSAAYY